MIKLSLHDFHKYELSVMMPGISWHVGLVQGENDLFTFGSPEFFRFALKTFSMVKGFSFHIPLNRMYEHHTVRANDPDTQLTSYPLEEELALYCTACKLHNDRAITKDEFLNWLEERNIQEEEQRQDWEEWVTERNITLEEPK